MPWQWVLKPGVFSDRAPVTLKDQAQALGEHPRVKLVASQVAGANWASALAGDRPERRRAGRRVVRCIPRSSTDNGEEYSVHCVGIEESPVQ